MRITNLTNEPRIIQLREKNGNILKLYLSPRSTKTIVEECILTDEAKSLRKARAISVRLWKYQNNYSQTLAMSDHDGLILYMDLFEDLIFTNGFE